MSPTRLLYRTLKFRLYPTPEVAGRRKAQSEPRRRPATPKPIVSPQRAGQLPDFVNANGRIRQADRSVVTGSQAGTGGMESNRN